MYFFAFGMSTRISRVNVPGLFPLTPPVGLPSALLCMWGSTFANATLFALIFPSVSGQVPIFTVVLPNASILST